MDITLPRRTDNRPALSLTDSHQITVIGANGAGKSRFCNALLKSVPEGKAFRMSALKAIYAETYHCTLKGSIEERFNRICEESPLIQSKASTEFERLFTVMLRDEFADLLAYKTRTVLGGDSADGGALPKTRLDKALKMWQEVFPKNRVLRAQGQLQFANDQGSRPYDSVRLSDGEKAVLYYIGAALYAMEGAVVLIDDPEVFIHRSIMQNLWNVIEAMRPDCTFIYSTHDVDFAASRTDNTCIWVRGYDAENTAWDYELMQPGDTLSDELYFDIVGSRKPVLFIEGDATHSIDSRLYPLIFTEYTIKPMGSCNKVIEATRAFNDLRHFHHLDSHGIVDRDRRDRREVEYLRQKKIFVPDAAEVENILLIEDVVRAVASYCRKDPDAVAEKVKNAVISMFEQKLRAQALEHVRHRVKRNVEMRIDKRFTCISALEDHMVDLVNEINPRGMYDNLCRTFHDYVNRADYAAVLRVFNEKKMLIECNVWGLCGLRNKDEYIRMVLNILKTQTPQAEQIRSAVKRCFGIDKPAQHDAVPDTATNNN